MSSFKNVGDHRVHLERSQPKHRRRLGLLEKHSDYVKRARDYHRKEAYVKILAEKARGRNPEEFNFKMVNTSLDTDSSAILLNVKPMRKALAIPSLNHEDKQQQRRAKKIKELRGLHNDLALLKYKKSIFNGHLKNERIVASVGSPVTQSFLKESDISNASATPLVDEAATIASGNKWANRMCTSRAIPAHDNDSLSYLTLPNPGEQTSKEWEAYKAKSTVLDKALQKTQLKIDLHAKGRRKRITDLDPTSGPIYKWLEERKK